MQGPARRRRPRLSTPVSITSLVSSTLPSFPPFSCASPSQCRPGCGTTWGSPCARLPQSIQPSPTETHNKFDPIQEGEAEDEEDEATQYDMYWSKEDEEACNAWDDYKDACDELDELRAAELEEARALFHSCPEFEEFRTEPADDQRQKIEKILTPASPHPSEVEKTMMDEGSRRNPDDDAWTREWEEFRKKQQFCRSYELKQEQRIAEQTAQAHAAIAGRTSYRILSDPKSPSQCTPSGAAGGLDF